MLLLMLAVLSTSRADTASLGCFVDSADRILPHMLPDIGYSPDSCAAGCEKLGTQYTVSGMEDGSQCFCGNYTALPAHIAPLDQCDMACINPR
jgi:hypothetical protein